jgi:hypothetical protein
MPGRNRAVSFLLMPIAVFIWFIGWSLCWIGIKKEAKQIQPILAVQKEIDIFVPAHEQQIAT